MDFFWCWRAHNLAGIVVLLAREEFGRLGCVQYGCDGLREQYLSRSAERDSEAGEAGEAGERASEAAENRRWLSGRSRKEDRKKKGKPGGVTHPDQQPAVRQNG